VIVIEKDGISKEAATEVVFKERCIRVIGSVRLVEQP
jgi:hypothetical protein